MELKVRIVLGILLVFSLSWPLECASFGRHFRFRRDAEYSSILNKSHKNVTENIQTTNSSLFPSSDKTDLKRTNDELLNENTSESRINEYTAKIKENNPLINKKTEDTTEDTEDEISRPNEKPKQNRGGAKFETGTNKDKETDKESKTLESTTIGTQSSKGIGRALNIDKYTSPDFHNKNNVYNLPTTPEIKKYLDYSESFSEDKPKLTQPKKYFESTSNDNIFKLDLTTPQTDIFDSSYRLIADGIKQNLDEKLGTKQFETEIFGDDHEGDYDVSKLIEKFTNADNDTDVTLHVTEYTNIDFRNVDNKAKKDTENGKHVDYSSSFSKSRSFDEKPPKAETVIINKIPNKDESEKNTEIETADTSNQSEQTAQSKKVIVEEKRIPSSTESLNGTNSKTTTSKSFVAASLPTKKPPRFNESLRNNTIETTAPEANSKVKTDVKIIKHFTSTTTTESPSIDPLYEEEKVTYSRPIIENAINISKRGSTKYVESYNRSSTTTILKDVDFDNKHFSIPSTATAWTLASLKDVPTSSTLFPELKESTTQNNKNRVESTTFIDKNHEESTTQIDENVLENKFVKVTLLSPTKNTESTTESLSDDEANNEDLVASTIKSIKDSNKSINSKVHSSTESFETTTEYEKEITTSSEEQISTTPKYINTSTEDNDLPTTSNINIDTTVTPSILQETTMLSTTTDISSESTEDITDNTDSKVEASANLENEPTANTSLENESTTNTSLDKSSTTTDIITNVSETPATDNNFTNDNENQTIEANRITESSETDLKETQTQDDSSYTTENSVTDKWDKMQNESFSTSKAIHVILRNTTKTDHENELFTTIRTAIHNSTEDITSSEASSSFVKNITKNHLSTLSPRKTEKIASTVDPTDDEIDDNNFGEGDPDYPDVPAKKDEKNITDANESDIENGHIEKIDENSITTKNPIKNNTEKSHTHEITTTAPITSHKATVSVLTTPENDNTTDTTSSTEQLLHDDDDDESNSGMIAAIAISSVGGVCLILLAGLLLIMRKRQKRMTYGQRCRPVSLDAYSLDNVSVYNSVRRKGALRASKRSYGNPAFDDPVSISHQMNFQSLVKFVDNSEEINTEFDEIPQVTARANEVPAGCETKNRYANVIPLPETRVYLKASDNDPHSDYINANYVTGPKNTRGYYIACQGPLQNTVDDFWRMIWEQQSRVILMLTNLYENGVEKCVDYLPPSEVLDCHRLFGDFQITLKKREVKEKYIISSLQLKNMVSNSWREVTHLWYLGWPERGVPSEANSLIAFLIEARSHLKAASNNNASDDNKTNETNMNISGVSSVEGGPMVVHCSPGTGRTGTVISCDIAIRDFELTRCVDIPKIVYRVRRDRASSVQTKEQYAFIYKVISLYATKLTGGALDSI